MNTEPRCKGCGEEASHVAHIEVWQTGAAWVPVCADRVLDWWDDDGVKNRRLAGAPDNWIRPLEVR